MSANQTVRIRMLKLAASPAGVLKDGETYDLEPARARDLIQARAAELVDARDIKLLQVATRGQERETAAVRTGGADTASAPEQIAAPFARGTEPTKPTPALTRAERRQAARAAKEAAKRGDEQKGES
ncbi:MAG TPA: hypothetical protein VK176_08335 [Phycisphaerales bacterium]|nr:hypothetical protein [Phycisphaerales bacterium]